MRASFARTFLAALVYVFTVVIILIASVGFIWTVWFSMSPPTWTLDYGLRLFVRLLVTGAAGLCLLALHEAATAFMKSIREP